MAVSRAGTLRHENAPPDARGLGMRFSLTDAPLGPSRAQSCSWTALSIHLCLGSVTSCLEPILHSASHHELLVLGTEADYENKRSFPSCL